jgi:hypothetical protein
MAFPNFIAGPRRRAGQRLRTSLLAVAACVAADACVASVGDVRDRAPAAALASLSCRQIISPAGDRAASVVRWHEHQGRRSRPTLDAWCRGVGPVVYQSQPSNRPGDSAPIRATDAIAVVSWNVNVGAGNLSALVADLRAGKVGRWNGFADAIVARAVRENS